jgi:ribosomal protein S18 acetylase RimI-like enzyme
MDASEIVYDAPRVEDAAAIGRLFFEDMSDLGVGAARADLDKMAERIVQGARAEQPTLFCRVARPGPTEQPCGVVLANFNWSLKFAGRALWIEELYVNPEFRRLGIGRALVDQVIDFAEANGFRGIDIEAYRGNTPASVLYRTMGFHRLGRERFYYRLGSNEFL